MSGKAETLGAVLLAGGKARRMGGRDKGLVVLAGQPMIARLVDTLKPLVQELVINANRNQAAYGAFGVPVSGDLRTGFAGPLAGLEAGLAVLSTDLVFMCPCDSPFVDARLVRRLLWGLGDSGACIAVAHDGRREQPVFCLVRRDVRASLSRFLDSGQGKIDRWYRGEDHCVVDCRTFSGVFDNINTEAERSAAEQRLLDGVPAGQP